MIISKKPVRSLTAILIGLISSVAMANPVTDTTHVKTEVVPQTEQVTAKAVEAKVEAVESKIVAAGAKVEEHTEELEALSPKEKINEHIQHHLADSYDFTLYSDEETGQH